MEYCSIKDNVVTCIIPFYNEDKNNLLKTIKLVSNISEIKNVIVIDDGSNSRETFDFVKNKFSSNKNVKVVRLSKNYGKSFAVKYALSLAFSDNIILLDADLKNIEKRQISNAILKFNLFDLDMLILRRVNSLPLVKLIRADTLLSGERIIKKEHLKKVLKTDVEGYQLEVAINQYFINNNLQEGCFWTSSSAVNNYKFNKLSFVKGFFKEVKMYFDIIRYVGIRNFITQIFEFCKKELH